MSGWDWERALKTLEKVQYLINRGFDVAAWERDGDTPLADVAHYIGRKRDAEFYFKKGASIDLRDKKGWTPLAISAHKGDKELVEFFIENGADLQAKTRGKTAQEIAEQAGHTEIATMLADAALEIDRSDEVVSAPEDKGQHTRKLNAERSAPEEREDGNKQR